MRQSEIKRRIKIAKKRSVTEFAHGHIVLNYLRSELTRICRKDFDCFGGMCASSVSKLPSKYRVQIFRVGRESCWRSLSTRKATRGLGTVFHKREKLRNSRWWYILGAIEIRVFPIQLRLWLLHSVDASSLPQKCLSSCLISGHAAGNIETSGMKTPLSQLVICSAVVRVEKLCANPFTLCLWPFLWHINISKLSTFPMIKLKPLCSSVALLCNSHMILKK